MSNFRPFLQIAASGRALTPSEMEGAMELLLEGGVSDAECAGFLMALQARGETPEEIAAAAKAMRARALRVDAPADAIDTCGTGGDGAGTFNISTAAALVAAGAGARVAKHGNRSASSKSGSAEVLETLGVKLDVAPEIISSSIEEAGVGFMFAAIHHRAVGKVAPVRKALGVRTLFNALGPLANPAGARRQLMGVYSQKLVEPMAQALLALGAERAWVVHGADGLDELTTTGETHVAEVRDGNVRRFTVSPVDAGVAAARAEDLSGGGPAENAAAIRDVLSGKPSAHADIVALNAAAALIVADIASDLRDGVARAREAIENGRAAAALEKLVSVSNRVTP